jgi:hypothetical protein
MLYPAELRARGGILSLLLPERGVSIGRQAFREVVSAFSATNRFGDAWVEGFL